MKLTHVDVTVPMGTITPEWERRVDALFVGVLGWAARSVSQSAPGQTPVPTRQFSMNEVTLVVRESAHALTGGEDDHLGFVVEGSTLDELVDDCIALAQHEPTLELRHVEDGAATAVDLGDHLFRTFFVRLLLPVWLQFEARDPVD